MPQQETGVRFIRVRGKIIPIRAGSRVFQRNKKTGEAKELKQSRDITRKEASTYMKDRSQFNKKLASKFNTVGNVSLGIAGGLGIAGKVFGKGIGKTLAYSAAGVSGFFGMLNKGAASKRRDYARAGEDEAKRIAQGKGVGTPKTMYGREERVRAAILRRFIRKGKTSA